MSHENELPAQSQPEVLSEDRRQTVDEWGRRAGAALRSPAPDNGASAIMRRARSQRIVRVGGAVLGVFAVVALAAIAVVVVNHRGDPDRIDTDGDPVVAESALISADVLGAGWAISHQFDGLSSRGVADVAAGVPECAPYVDYAFDSPHRQAVTSGRIFKGPPAYSLTQWVYIFPTEAAASRAMDKIAEESFRPCFDKFMDALSPVLISGLASHTTSIQAPSVAAHGDRQVIVAQSIQYEGARFTVISAFIQVGRGIAYIDPLSDAQNGVDPSSPVERATSAATNALTNALSISNG